MNSHPWRKLAAFKFNAARSALSSTQWVAILEATATIAIDPYSEKLKPIVHANGDREIEVAGVWLRYRIDPLNRAVIYLDARLV